ncbi:MAG TPA: UDP-N-acetylmuramoylalanyl-D-glutamyl-2,6-diaminopimelate--D-alanyl-D-alanine ligase [Hyphomicrobiaceae bacterium]|nr:UDP-N-acetylmuramoylalanyl-D-glutamyl-2,6-diaminopimelate--D-alanyl-D-alanine ligase [Hyphomicrobiaceae bacterium]
MSEPLWNWTELVTAADGIADGTPAWPIRGLSIDTRTLHPGDVFVALRDKRDGHDFVPAAFRAGAVAAIVRGDYQRGAAAALVRVADPLEALTNIARIARLRSSARMVAITGSVGKTGTKEMLSLCLSELGRTHAAEKSYNNHWGVPLTLARLPRDTEYGVFEIGMNHPGEIRPLTQLVTPHEALITSVEPVHLGHFGSVAEIAEAKAEILIGLVPGGTAILPRDNAHFKLLRERANEVGAKIVTFGYHQDADFRGLQVDLGPKGSSVIAGFGTQRFPYRLGAPGEHYVKNSLAVLACLSALGVDIMKSLPALARISAPAGRGARTLLETDDGQLLLIDESYNANPASVRAALAAMATTPRDAYPRRIAVLGDMLELGDAAPELHRGLTDAIDAAGIDLVLASGPLMRLLLEGLTPAQRGAWAPTSVELVEALIATVRSGDVVMIKGSLGSNMAPLVAALRTRLRVARSGG